MSKIDRYLQQSLRADAGDPTLPTEAMFPTADALATAVTMTDMAISDADFDTGIEPVTHAEAVVPLLFRVDRADWTGEGVPDLRIHSRMGSVVSAHGSMKTLAALERDDAVQSIEASRPLESPGELSSSVPLVNGSQVHSVLGEQGDGALIGVIDEGIDVLHEAFRNARGTSRILGYWDQEDASGIPAPHPAGYGTLHTRADIDGYITAGAVPATLDRNVDGHGTHVASIAAGRNAGAFAGGMAPEALLVVVRARQRRFESGQVSSLGYSHNHVDALAWIGAMAKEADLPVVVNVSQGMNAGAHDGSSLLETAFDEFSAGGRAAGRVVVKSAGNEGGKRGHARLTIAQGATDVIQWTSDPVPRNQDLIEVWFSSGHQLEFWLENPRGDLSQHVTLATPTQTGTFTTTAGIDDQWDLDLERLHLDNGDSRLLVRIHRGGATAAFEPGTWTLHVQAVKTFGACQIDGWIERRNTRALEFGNHLFDDCSLSIPGTARTVIAVASVSPIAPFAIAASSSRGPTRDARSKPDVTAPGDGIKAARGGTLSAVRVERGTSMAAPHVAGALALLMSHWGKQKNQVPDWRQLNAMQMRAALVNTATGFAAQFNSSSGFGRLDTLALLKYFP